jgi:hypothetical protein
MIYEQFILSIVAVHIKYWSIKTDTKITAPKNKKIIYN